MQGYMAKAGGLLSLSWTRRYVHLFDDRLEWRVEQMVGRETRFRPGILTSVLGVDWMVVVFCVWLRFFSSKCPSAWCCCRSATQSPSSWASMDSLSMSRLSAKRISSEQRYVTPSTCQLQLHRAVLLFWVYCKFLPYFQEQQNKSKGWAFEVRWTDTKR